MTKETPLEQARYIFTRGKMIHDRVQRIVAGHIASGKGHQEFRDLSVAQLHVFMQVRHRGEVTIKELAELLGVAPPSASAMVDRLVEKRFLSREMSQEDRRKVTVRISPEAMVDIEKTEEAVLSSFVDLVEKVGPDTAHKWCEVLERIKSILEEEANLNKKHQDEIK
ncbi:MarR family winged helix-turn-helix transcriptional regulator [Thermodesulfobacteriota bacterium]